MAATEHAGKWRLGLVICVLLASPLRAKTIYVDDSAVSRNNGTSWVDAFTNLTDAIAKARPDDEIRVAQGLYRPTILGGDREESFLLGQANGATIRGGYAGLGAPDPDARDVETYETILSGDLNGDDGPDGRNNGENSYHVLTGTGTDETTVLDGFIITAGNANGLSPEHQNGGGMFNDGGSPTMIDCRFIANICEHDGGAVFNKGGAPTLIRCRFRANSAKYGGAMQSVDSRPVLIQCAFIHNRASYGGGLHHNQSHAELAGCAFYGNSAGHGGGMFNNLSDPNVVNCLFSGNSGTRGGGLFNYGSRPTLANCTLSGNSAAFGGGIYSVEAAPTLANCILWGNSSASGKDEEAQVYMDGGDLAVSYCCIQGWTGRHPGSANIYLDPLFVDDDGKDGVTGTEDDDLRLLRTSPCIDTGDSNALPSDILDLDSDKDMEEPIPFDHAGNPRVCDEAVDRGAFEFYEIFVPGPVIYVDANATPPGDGRSWSTALTSLQHAIQMAAEYRVVRKIHVAGGVYTPAGPNGPREATFLLISNVAIRGSYAGHGRPDPNNPDLVADPNARDLQAWPTILSGDLNHDDADVADPCDLLAEPTRADNCYHVVTGSGTDVTAVLDGFTITGGTANGMYDEDGGGIYIMTGGPTILHCTFRGNAARNDGGGICCLFSDPNISACTIEGNCAGVGGGICCAAASPQILDSTIADNYAIGDGAGIICDYLSSPLIARNTIRDNKTHLHGGGICCLGGSDPRILCNRIAGNSAYDGGGIYCLGAHPHVANNMIIHNTAEDDGGGICAIEGSRPTILNNTIVRNRANPQGGGIFVENAQATITNCILWENGDDFHNWTPAYACSPIYSCIQDGDAGEGNISMYPHFRDPQNEDYHLKPYSPCIDTGSTATEMFRPDNTDFDGDRRVQFLCVDIGADETPFWKKFQDNDKNGLPDGWEEEHFGGVQVSTDDDPDNDDSSNLIEYQRGTNPHVAQRLVVYVSSANNSDPAADGSPEHPFTSIQQAIEQVRDGGQILVTEGTFHERLIIDGKTVFIQGGYNLAFTRVERYTVLTADGQGRGVLYLNVPDGMLSGFIITDGFEKDGGGMYFLNSSPQVRDNIIMGNAAVDDGGGVSFYFGSTPLFEDNIIADNFVGDNAGGIYCREASPRIRRCLITGNMAEDGGAMRLRNATPSIVDCIITGNMATDEGGAIICREAAAPVISGCTISNNYAGGKGGGLAVSEGSDVTIRDSILRGNVRQAVWANKATIRIEGTVETFANDWKARDLMILGEGDLRVGTGDVLQMDNCRLCCNLTGQGDIQVELESELVIEGDARVDLGHPTDPRENGTIQCDGLLHVRDSAQLTGATIRVTRASFEGDVDITNSIIEAEAGMPYGQFFVAGTVRITGSDIHADGDRYIDLDPAVFDGLVRENRIYVSNRPRP